MKQHHIFKFPNGYVYAVLNEKDAVQHLSKLKISDFTVKSEISGVATFYTVFSIIRKRNDHI